GPTKHRGTGEELGPELQAGRPALPALLRDRDRGPPHVQHDGYLRRGDPFRSALHPAATPVGESAAHFPGAFGTRTARAPRTHADPSRHALQAAGAIAQTWNQYGSVRERAVMAMPDFTSVLYLGMYHGHQSLRPWRQLTT